jgi:hypothetical protein
MFSIFGKSNSNNKSYNSLISKSKSIEVKTNENFAKLKTLHNSLNSASSGKTLLSRFSSSKLNSNNQLKLLQLKQLMKKRNEYANVRYQLSKLLFQISSDFTSSSPRLHEDYSKEVDSIVSLLNGFKKLDIPKNLPPKVNNTTTTTTTTTTPKPNVVATTPSSGGKKRRILKKKKKTLKKKRTTKKRVSRKH